ncbi:DUF1365 domain-containing protein [Antrihabitans spumae]|jgi:uncharacterized protein|uniref:DUF1365 domain-containing protein n=1 Tax=Antrihabitans spumae TaxID=3373370 RepID=A0ABW7JU54_9NOCA
MKPALFETQIRHARLDPIRHSFEYRSYSWFVDLDELPRLPLWLRPFAKFRAVDHFEAPVGDDYLGPDTLRGRVEAFLASEGVAFRGGRITALLNARVLGHVFNPLSVFWCRDDDGVLRWVIAEVHNTYGERHPYLLELDGAGRAQTDKQFYVSPFNEVDGRYDMSVPEPEAELAVRITLRRDGRAPFVATMRGRRLPATTRTVVRAQLRTPLAPLVVSARIRKQGIWLWARGLPVVPRVAVSRGAKESQEVGQ